MGWSDLVALAAGGGVDPADLVWQPDWDDWRIADTVEGLLPVPTSDTGPVTGTPADEVSVDALVDEISASEAPDERAATGAVTPVDDAPEEEVAGPETAVVEVPGEEPPVEETSAYGFPIGEAPADVVADAEPAAAAASPATRLGGVVVPPSLPRPLLQRPVEAVLGVVGRVLPAPTMDRIDRTMVIVGQIAYLLAALLVAVLLLVDGIRSRDASAIIYGLAVLPVALLLGYSASRVLEAIGARIESSPTSMGRCGFLEAFAACAIGLGLLACAAGVAVTVAGIGAGPALAGLGAALVLFYAAAAAIDPAIVSVTPRDGASTGREAVAILSFVAKLVLLRLVPVAFAAAALVMTMTVLWMLVSQLRNAAALGFIGAWIAWRVLGVALLPMVAWLAFHVAWLLIAVAGSLIASGDTPADPEGDD